MKKKTTYSSKMTDLRSVRREKSFYRSDRSVIYGFFGFYAIKIVAMS